MDEPYQQLDWPHAPVHRLDSSGVYMITAATLHKKHLFAGSLKLDLLQGELLSLAKQYYWQLQAWALFPNHYHFIARTESTTPRIREFLRHFHGNTARQLNRLDRTAGRTVWFNFWDSKLTYQRSYLARLNYVHQNPVKHGVAQQANQYRWCSAGWFERTAAAAVVKSVYNFKIDRLRIADDY